MLTIFISMAPISSVVMTKPTALHLYLPDVEKPMWQACFANGDGETERADTCFANDDGETNGG